MKSGVYIIMNNLNGKVYVGSSQNIKNRFSEHLRDLRRNRNHNRYLQRAWNKYGEEAFKFVVVEKVPVLFLFEFEQYYIDHYQAANSRYGYNSAPFADGPRGVKWTQACKDRHSKRLKGNIIVSEEARLKISSALKGYIKTQETREKLRAANLGKIIPEEQRLKISLKLKGQKLSEETKLKMSKSRKGHPCYSTPESKIKSADAMRKLWTIPEYREKFCKGRKGRKQSDETKKKRSEAMKLKWQDPEYVRLVLEKRNSPESKDKLSKALKGRISPNKGKTFSDEHRAKLSQSAKRRKLKG